MHLNCDFSLRRVFLCTCQCVYGYLGASELQMVESLFSISETDAHGDLRVFPLCLNLSVLLTMSLSPPQPGPMNSLPRGGWDNEDYSVKHY